MKRRVSTVLLIAVVSVLRPPVIVGAPPIVVLKQPGGWLVKGSRVAVAINASSLAIHVQAGPAAWSLMPSSGADMIVRDGAEQFPLGLADATSISITPYDTGFKTGVKIVMSGWRYQDRQLDLVLFLTIALEGRDEELVLDIAAREGRTILRQLDWPTALDAREIDYTVLNHYRGILLPRTWPAEFNPIRAGASRPNETTEIQSNVIESWSMPWWGFQKGPAAAMVIVETPDDAAYRFRHPAGGPTVIGARWRSSLGRFAYPRSVRMCFFDKGTYVELAKRYRRYALDTGLFVSLKEKIARSPRVESLIGTPLTRLSILRNLRESSARYDKSAPDKSYQLTTFDQAGERLKALKAAGFDRFHVCLTGWPHLGYDRQHPDVLPPTEAAGGWEGMARLTQTARRLGYVLTLHDQYRDYYTDAPSYDTQFAVHEEDDKTPPQAFPGSRFGQWKEGPIPFMNNWDGGTQTYLNSRFMLGHLVKNHEALAAHGVQADGSYLDVFGYVPPDEDFNPEHPTTRADSIKARAACFLWVRRHLGIVGTEAAVDWTVPHADFSSPLGPGRAGIPVPLFNLVYHDAIVTPYAPNDLRGFLNGGLPQVSLSALTGAGGQTTAARVREMATLHQRLALLEMTRHEFLDRDHTVERTTFADGTTVRVDWRAQAYTVEPDAHRPRGGRRPAPER